MNVIKLNKKEGMYLMTSNYLPLWFKNKVNNFSFDNKNYPIELSDDQLNDMRDLFGERLQIAGFDEIYDLTPEGEILENLIDKFLK